MNNVTVKGPFIDGFAIDCCGEGVITYKDDIYTIDCWEGTYDETVEAISEEYSGTDKNAYINKLREARDMNWLTDELHKQLKDDLYVDVRITVAGYSDKYHDQLKDDENWRVRLVVAKYSDKYHEQLKDDPNAVVRAAVANYKKEK